MHTLTHNHKQVILSSIFYIDNIMWLLLRWHLRKAYIPCLLGIIMSYDKYERGCQHLNSGHQKITYKKINNNYNRIKIKIILTLQLTQSNQWVSVDHAA